MKVLGSSGNVADAKRLARHVWRHFSEDRLFDEAASLSYASLLSMVPLLAVVFGVASAFPVFQQWSEQLRAFVFSNFVPASGGQIQAYLEGFLGSVASLTLPGTLLLIVGALLLMFRIERALNLIWRVQACRSIRGRLIMYWAVLTLGPLILGAAAALGAQPVFEQISLGVSTRSNWRALGIFSLSWLAFTVMFLLVPNRRVRITHALAGAFMSALLFGVARKVFVIFVAKSSFNIIYGALAAIPIFLFWLYLVWLVILLGASLAASLTTFSGREKEWAWPLKWELLLAYRLLGHLWRAQAAGRALSLDELVDMVEGATEDELLQQLESLFDAGLVTRDENGSWLLCRDLETVSLLDLYRGGKFYLPVGEEPDVPSASEWDGAFLAAIRLDDLDMRQSLKAMYASAGGAVTETARPPASSSE